MTVPAVTFLAPPSAAGTGSDAGYDATYPDAMDVAAPRPARQGRRGAKRGTRNGLRMTRGARAAATGMNVADDEIRRCLDAPDTAHPDPKTPTRTRFSRGKLVVVAGADGMVVRVDRRKR